jgi:hypothetical protein
MRSGSFRPSPPRFDAAPDPEFGLFRSAYSGSGGDAGAGKPRRPRPAPVAGTAERDEPSGAVHDLVVET